MSEPSHYHEHATKLEEVKNAAIPSSTSSDMEEHEHDQAVLFYDGSPMHDYLAEVAPDEVPVMDMRRSTASSPSSLSKVDQHGAGGVTSSSVTRRKSRSHSNASSTSSQSRRRRSSQSQHSLRSRDPTKRHSRTPHNTSNTNTKLNTAMLDISDDPLFNEAKERLNLLLVSYLSAPHYSALPLQDQESIDRETVNAFLLDERFQQRYGDAGSNRRRRRSLLSSSNGRDGSRGLVESGTHLKDGTQEHEQPQTRITMTRPAQIFFLGLCSIALLTPAFSSASALTATSASSEVTYSAFHEMVNAFLPPHWPSWTNTLVRTVPGVVALTSLTAYFARSSSSNSSIASQAGSLNQHVGADQQEMEEIIRELRKLFNVCKKFIDECTRLDITLEKGFTVLSELDRLAGLDGGESADEEYRYDLEEEASTFEGDGRDARATGNWQDLTAIEARLSTSHPAQYASPAKHARDRKRQQQQRRKTPALSVRQAIFASLYTIQDRLEKDLDALARSFDTSPERKDDQEVADQDIDTLELVRLLDMYNCHPPPYTNQNLASAAHEDEEAAERLYSRTMARRSLSPTLYTEQQHTSQSTHATSAASKLKRRSGMYIPAPPSSVREEPVSSIQQTFGINNEEQLGRRASWAAFHPDQRRQIPPQPTTLHQGQSVATLNAPPSPSSSSSTGGGLHNLARNQGTSTPPRLRPQSIHFGGVIPSSAVTSSPLANGARESNSTIKRERRRRSEQLFSLASLQTNNLHSHLTEDDALAQLRSSTSSATSTSSSIGSSALMRMSTSSQGTSADPVTAASIHSDLYDSPSRPTHIRRTSLEPTVNSGLLRQKQQSRRSRPLSMHELDFGRSMHRTSLSLLTGDPRRTSLDEVPEADSTASHRNAAAAALERRWSANPPGPVSASIVSAHSKVRDRPTSLLLQSSPILSSSPARRSPDIAESPAASFRSRKQQQQQQQMTVKPRSKFAVTSLRESSEQVSKLERALVCHLLALKYSSISRKKLRHVLMMLIELVERVNASISTESASLTQTMWEEFEDSPAKAAAAEEAGTTAPPTSVLLATPMTSNSPFQSTPRRGSFIACLPGSYPSSPIIEVDPATPPLDTARQTPQGSFFRRYDNHEEASMQVQQNFAPRDPFSTAEQTGRTALAESHAQLNAALRSIATKVYIERQDLKEYFNASRASPAEVAAQQYTIQQLEARQESMRADVQNLMRAWEDGRASLRQIKDGRQRRIQGPQSTTRTVDGQEATSDRSEYDNAEEEPSLMSASAELEKLGSISSALSSGNEDSLSTPALSPMSSASYQPLHISELLLDSTDPAHLPRYGMQEQLFESYVGQVEDQPHGSKGHAKLSREERIALAKVKRLEKQEKQVSKSDPQANAELISELKDVVALLRSRNAAVLADQQ